MAVELKGEVSLVDGEASLTLCLDIPYLAQAEKLLGSDVLTMGAQIRRLGVARGLLWGALRKHHPDKAKVVNLDHAAPDRRADLSEVDAIIKRVGLLAVFDALGAAMRAAFPQEGDAPPSPPPPAGGNASGTGRSSTASGAG
jgi:hypothetical protein